MYYLIVWCRVCYDVTGDRGPCCLFVPVTFDLFTDKLNHDSANLFLSFFIHIKNPSDMIKYLYM